MMSRPAVPMLSAKEMKRLMRVYRCPLLELKTRADITLGRIRYLRKNGVESAAAARDIIQHITGEDPGLITKAR